AAIVLAFGALAGGAGIVFTVTAKEKEIPKENLTITQEVKAKNADVNEEEKIRVDVYGDALPNGAIARIGTIRFWPDDAAGGVGRTIAYTPDGKHLISGAGKAVCFVNLVTGKETRRLEVEGVTIFKFVLSPDGKTIVTLGSRGAKPTNEIRIW